MKMGNPIKPLGCNLKSVQCSAVQCSAAGCGCGEADSAVPDAVTTVSKHVAKHGCTERLHLGPGKSGDEQAHSRARHTELLQEPDRWC